MPKFSSGIKKQMNFKQNVHNTWGRKEKTKRCQLKLGNRYGLKLVE